MNWFLNDIKKFNEMYKLPNNDHLTNLGDKRIQDFANILQEEVMEYTEIMEVEGNSTGAVTGETLVMMADWLGDIIVYCASEARRWGIPLEQVLKIIMESNFSKLGEDGKPIYDERGKVLKGPNYWKPESKIAELLTSETSEEQRLRNIIAGFYDAIKHGDSEHQKWLKEQVDNYLTKATK